MLNALVLATGAVQTVPPSPPPHHDPSWLVSHGVPWWTVLAAILLALLVWYLVRVLTVRRHLDEPIP